MILFRPLQAVILAILVLAAPQARAAAAGNRITVLAAASLAGALSEIGRGYEAASGERVALSFAGSMILAKQIEASSGADLFISADEESMDFVDGKGLIAKATRVNLLGNALVLVAPANSTILLKIAPGFQLSEALMGGRLALANTEAVPAGRYARAALTALGVWDSVASHLAEGEDVRAALAYVARGETRLGIVYVTDAHAEARVRVVGTFPQSTHPAILYPAALTRDANPDAAAFLAYLKGAQARAVFERAGFKTFGPS